MPPPPIGESNPLHNDSKSNMVTIDVGGQLFQTTKQTLSLAGSNSLLSTISNSDDAAVFIDRDPELFSIMLSLLRTGNLPSKAKAYDIQDLIFESQFYGIENLLLNSLSDPSQFDAFDLEKSMVLPLNGRDTPSAISTTQYGSLHVAHGSKITSFDGSLHRKTTVLTQFTAIDSLQALSPTLAAAGAADFSGLQIIDLEENGEVKQTLHWENITKSSSTVLAIGKSPQCLFASFESSRRNSNCIMMYDLSGSTIRPLSKIAHYEIFGSDLDSGLPATKLQWVEAHNMLAASGSHSSPSGVSGNIRFYDVRSSGNAVWEFKEKADCFADVTVSDTLSAMFKVGVQSAQVYFADLRRMNSGEGKPWICLEDERRATSSGKREGYGCKMEAHGDHLFCSKGSNIELWSEVLVGDKGDGSVEDRVFRKNLMGRVKDAGRNRVGSLCFGGNKMFVTRKDQQFVEVWGSSYLSFV